MAEPAASLRKALTVSQLNRRLKSLIENNIKRRGVADRILVKDGTTVHVIPLETVEYFEAADDFVSIHTGTRTYLKHGTMADLESSLDPAKFLRIHRSYILNLSHMARLESATKDSRVVVLRSGTKLPVSKTGYDRLKTLLS